MWILFLVLTFCCYAGGFSIDYEKSLKNKILSCFLFVCAGLSFGLFFSYVGVFDKSKEFPVSEYTLEYKIITIGEKSDTTYVLTKIKEN